MTMLNKTTLQDPDDRLNRREKMLRNYVAIRRSDRFFHTVRNFVVGFFVTMAAIGTVLLVTWLAI